MNEELWRFVDAFGELAAGAWGLPHMTGRVLGWLLVCDPPEQTAAGLAEALRASKGSISAATGMLVRMRLVDRLHIRGERADRFRLRPGAWDEQMGEQDVLRARGALALGLAALDGEPPARLARLHELDAFYAWWEERLPGLREEWREYRRARLGAA